MKTKKVFNVTPDDVRGMQKSMNASVELRTFALQAAETANTLSGFIETICKNYPPNTVLGFTVDDERLGDVELPHATEHDCTVIIHSQRDLLIWKAAMYERYGNLPMIMSDKFVPLKRCERWIIDVTGFLGITMAKFVPDCNIKKYEADSVAYHADKAAFMSRERGGDMFEVLADATRPKQ